MQKILSIFILAVILNMNAHSQSLKLHPQIRYTSYTTEVSSIPSNYNTVVKKLDKSHKLVVDDYEVLLKMFKERNYTPEAWQSGIREIPRLYVTSVGDWGTKGSKEVNVLNKKRIFFRGIAPVILHANELIMDDRKRLEKNITAFELNNALNEQEEEWIKNLAATYNVDMEDSEITLVILRELYERVDIIPASLALAQAAAESG